MALTTNANTSSDNRSTGLIIGGIALVILVILVAGGCATATFLGWNWAAILAGFRDVMIILLAFGSLCSLIVIGYILFQLYLSIQQLRTEIQPAIEAIRETTGNVRGTTSFVSETAVEPIVKVISTASAVSAFARTLLRGNASGNGTKP